MIATTTTFFRRKNEVEEKSWTIPSGGSQTFYVRRSEENGRLLLIANVAGSAYSATAASFAHKDPWKDVQPPLYKPKDRNLAVGRPTVTSVGKDARTVFDDDPTSSWNAGRGPTVWVEVDLGRASTISRITLTPEQSPPTSYAVHQIIGKREDGSEVKLSTVAQNSTTGTPITVIPNCPELGRESKK